MNSSSESLLRSRNIKDLAKILEAIHTADTSNPSVVLEIAELYNVTGDYEQAIFQLERLRMLDFTSVRGMDLLAMLYYNHSKNDMELEKLSNYCKQVNGEAAETFIVLGYLARRTKPKSAYIFAQWAAKVADTPRIQSACYILMASIKADQVLIQEAEKCWKKALTLDNKNIDAYDVAVSVLAQHPTMREAVARQLGDACRKHMGTVNPRVQYIYARAIAGYASMKADYQAALEDIVRRAPQVHQAVKMLADLYISQRVQNRAVLLLERTIASNPHQELIDHLKEIVQISEMRSSDKSSRMSNLRRESLDGDSFNRSYPTPDTASTSTSVTGTATTPITYMNLSATQRMHAPTAPRRLRPNMRIAALEIVNQSLEFPDEVEEMPSSASRPLTRRDEPSSESEEEVADEEDEDSELADIQSTVQEPFEQFAVEVAREPPVMQDLDDHQVHSAINTPDLSPH